MKNIEIEGILVRANAGAALYSCLIDAACLAMTERKGVTLTHNGRVYSIKHDDLLEVIDDIEPTKL